MSLTVSALPVNPVPPSAHLPEEVWDNSQVHGHMHTAAFSASYCSRILFLKDGRIFHELVRGEKERRAFLNEILDVMTLTGGERSHDV